MGTTEEKMDDLEQQIWKKAKQLRMSKVTAAIISILFGIILLVWPSTSLTVVCKCLGVALAFGGLVAVVLYFVNHDGMIVSSLQLVGGVVIAVIGGWIFFSPKLLVSIIPIIVGIIVVIAGVNDLSETITLGKQKYDKWWVSLILAIVTILLGLLLVFQPWNVATFIVQIIGVVVIFNGISDLWIISRISTDVKNAVQDADAMDVTAESVVTEATDATATAQTTAEDATATAQTTTQDATATAQTTAQNATATAQATAEVVTDAETVDQTPTAATAEEKDTIIDTTAEETDAK